MLELKSSLQSEILEKERLTIEIKSLEERHMHAEQLNKQRFELQLERDKAAGERALSSTQQRLAERSEELLNLQQKVEKLETQNRELQHQNKKDFDETCDKMQEKQAEFDK